MFWIWFFCGWRHSRGGFRHFLPTPLGPGSQPQEPIFVSIFIENQAKIHIFIAVGWPSSILWPNKIWQKSKSWYFCLHTCPSRCGTKAALGNLLNLPEWLWLNYGVSWTEITIYQRFCEWMQFLPQALVKFILKYCIDVVVSCSFTKPIPISEKTILLKYPNILNNSVTWQQNVLPNNSMWLI